MYARLVAKKEAFAALRCAIGKKFTLTADMLVLPPKPEMGDFSFPCFTLAKGMGRNPAEIATELAAKIGPTPLLRKIVATGPYVNFSVDPVAYGNRVLADVLKMKKRYGRGTTGKGKRVLVEYAQPNTHKEFHVGHLRNAIYGQAIVNLTSANGYETIAAAYIGDVGAHVAKAIWGFTKFFSGQSPSKEDRTKVLGDAYTKATQFVDENPDAKQEISDIQRKLEAEEQPWFGLWRETREWSLEDFRKIFIELGVKPSVWYFESEVEKPGKELVNTMLVQGIARKSEGATIVDLVDEDLCVFLVLKTDGSSLYATKDLALALQKDRDYAPDRQIFVIDVRQSLYMKQLFATLKRMEFHRELLHLGYEMVTLPDGAMSSRKGNIIRYTDLRDAMLTALMDSTKLRHPDWKEKKIRSNALTLTLAAMKFMMLRQDPGKVLVFDMEEAMSTEGFSGPYILYSIARIQSLMAKTSLVAKPDAGLLLHPLEIAILRILAHYPDVVLQAGIEARPSVIAQYAFDLAQAFSHYYAEVRILDGADDATIGARLALAGAVEQTLRNAMDILNIDVVKAM
mgnify:CR=1 FL=1